jgi:NitT/TauT family transport system substrate-binding protein
MKPSLMRIGAAVAALALSGAAQAQDKLSLVLNWLPGADHAPIFYAQKMGWYKQAGVDLQIENGKGSGFAAQKVASGDSQVGIVDMMTAFDVRGKGAEMTAVMALYANSPYGLYWKKSSGIKGPKDFVGKKIGTPPGDAARTVWPAMAKVFGIPEDSIRWVNVAPEGKIAALQTGAIDVTSHFYSVHYIYERTFNQDMGFVALREMGFNPYGNAIFANPKAVKSQAGAIRKFVHVTQRAYVACLENPRPCVEALAQAASQNPQDVQASWDNTRVLLVDEHSRKSAFGWFDPARMESDYRLAKASYKDMKDFAVQEIFSNEFLDRGVKAK